MKSKLLVVVGGIVLSAFVGRIALAQGHEGPRESGRDHGPGGPPPLERVLGLTDEQRPTFQALRQELDEGLRPLRDEERRAGEELRKSLDAAKPDPMAVGQKAIALHAVRNRMKALHDRFHDRLVEILDPQQREKLQLMDEMHPHGGDHHGPPPPPE